MNAPVDAAVHVLCPELVSLQALEHAIANARSNASLVVGSGHELACARLTLVEMLDELAVALRCYRDERVASTSRLPF